VKHLADMFALLIGFLLILLFVGVVLTVIVAAVAASVCLAPFAALGFGVYILAFKK